MTVDSVYPTRENKHGGTVQTFILLTSQLGDPLSAAITFKCDRVQGGRINIRSELAPPMYMMWNNFVYNPVSVK
jgi:hypothetical protein